MASSDDKTRRYNTDDRTKKYDLQDTKKSSSKKSNIDDTKKVNAIPMHITKKTINVDIRLDFRVSPE